jgi:hypothetical protein
MKESSKREKLKNSKDCITNGNDISLLVAFEQEASAMQGIYKIL